MKTLLLILNLYFIILLHGAIAAIIQLFWLNSILFSSVISIVRTRMAEDVVGYYTWNMRKFWKLMHVYATQRLHIGWMERKPFSFGWCCCSIYKESIRASERERDSKRTLCAFYGTMCNIWKFQIIQRNRNQTVQFDTCMVRRWSCSSVWSRTFATSHNIINDRMRSSRSNEREEKKQMAVMMPWI